MKCLNRKFQQILGVELTVRVDEQNNEDVFDLTFTEKTPKLLVESVLGRIVEPKASTILVSVKEFLCCAEKVLNAHVLEGYDLGEAPMSDELYFYFF